ncbi:MAG: hypothetical protein UV37_C0014G0021 [Candidatus Collierbacteria bacterium GW2011_GWA1_42_60]|jgi:hypothetical protein|uniref:Uncharacterized protein n=1 Tax=Candidatus Collierbacteria bacterium GW2011_GWA2_42_17 TaxID=1618378 RepID=A0A0G1B8I2_9BACT|nr:MAG: hypothetical protein UU94_C0009G0002 [Candidatus Collierbacteria bacterium GW2011_GWB2_42_12]KKS42616.1 MAG: hypothetical protein UV06_C0009G0036 [Candidatus Collierbacteria bacterium GW2011_GWA2_42_17]KKS62040.1 MAG: hypothetical protein UV30_C0025G0003 [Candidatus Collierbacteria bacterium GW2011_GWF1_42_50]KKS62599.1 MAG: hypothetical protein UV29_C0013G0003 [Candidatus Collierbacteria bacterium GW2011_GWD2_42_50]KKS62631.1 MAG: hypothetical protein UV28_C0007G0001 [Candidatus Collie
MQSVDALAVKAEEGRFKPAKVIGEVARTYDPVVSEWGNLTRFIWLLRFDLSKCFGNLGN